MDGKMESFISHASRNSDLFDDFVNHLVRAQAIGVGFITQDESGSQAVVYDRPHIVGSHVVVAVQPGVAARGLVQGEGATWASADVNPALEVFAVLLRTPRRSDECDDVTFDCLGYSNLVDLSTGLEVDVLMTSVVAGPAAYSVSSPRTRRITLSSSGSLG
jgi:hypothetical protein